MDPALQQLISEGSPDDEVEVIIKLKDSLRLPTGVRVITRFGNVATVRMRRENISPVYDTEEIFSMKAARVFDSTVLANEHTAAFPNHPIKTDVQRSLAHGPAGKGVVVGVIDWGIDFAHPNFRNTDGSTRFKAIWDQSQPLGPATPQPYGYGRVYLREEINEALVSGRPYDFLNYHPAKSDTGIGTHGTHVMDIAAGNGSVGLSGVAPAADLVFVHLSAKTTPGTTLGDSVRILEGIDFISKIAAEQPAVINTSIGTHGGNHRGTSLVEQGIDAFLALNDNRVLCQSTGNYHLAKAHASGIVRPGRSSTLRFSVDQADVTPNELEIWYAGNDQIIVTLSHTDAEGTFVSRLDQNREIRIGGEIVGMIYHRSREPNSGLNHVDIFLYKTAPPGKWSVELFGETIVDGRYHAWIERDNGCRQCQAIFDPEFIDTYTTIGIICNGYHTVTVGAYDSHKANFELASFSSKGPTADGRIKPDLVAPGAKILAARSTPRTEKRGCALLTRMSGTSMATPHVTGAVALILEMIHKPVSVHNIRNILLSSTDEQPVAPAEKMRVGSGSLNIEKALRQVEHYNHQLFGYSGVLHSHETTLQTDNRQRYPTNGVASIFEGYHTAYQGKQATPRFAVQAQLLEKVLKPYAGACISPDAMFKAFLGYQPRLQSYLRRYFEVIALPGAAGVDAIQAGDIMIKKHPVHADQSLLAIIVNTMPDQSTGNSLYVANHIDATKGMLSKNGTASQAYTSESVTNHEVILRLIIHHPF